MIQKIEYAVVSPQAEVAAGEAELMIIPAAEGQMGVMEGHQPVIATFDTGLVRIRERAQTSEGEMLIFVRSGFVDATPGFVQVLAEEAERVDPIDKSELASAIDKAQNLMQAAEQGTETYSDAKRDLERLKVLAQA
jgi:F-type H+-transporting ATPase subunit epsilon